MAFSTHQEHEDGEEQKDEGIRKEEERKGRKKMKNTKKNNKKRVRYSSSPHTTPTARRSSVSLSDGRTEIQYLIRIITMTIPHIYPTAPGAQGCLLLSPPFFSLFLFLPSCYLSRKMPSMPVPDGGAMAGRVGPWPPLLYGGKVAREVTHSKLYVNLPMIHTQSST